MTKALVGALSAAFLLCGSAAAQEIVVSDNANLSRILVFRQGDTGNVGPIRKIEGDAALMTFVQHVFVDSVHDEIYVTDDGPPSRVLVFDRKANGDVAPKRILTSPGVFSSPWGVTVDFTRNEVLVSDITTNAVYAFPRASSGDTAPVRTLGGVETDLDNPSGLFVDDANDELIVTDNPDVSVFPQDANGDVEPLRQVRNVDANVSAPIAAVIDDAHDEMLICQRFANQSVAAFLRTGSGNLTPFRFLPPGGATTIDEPDQIVYVPATDEILVASDTAIQTFPRLPSGDVAPTRVITGAATGLTNVYGVGLYVGTQGGVLRGDANTDGSITVADVFYLINNLFAAGPPPATLINGDADRSETVAVGDVFFLISHLFAGGPVP